MDWDCLALARLVCDDHCCLFHGVRFPVPCSLACAVFLVFGACLGWAEDSLARKSGAMSLAELPSVLIWGAPKTASLCSAWSSPNLCDTPVLRSCHSPTLTQC